METYLTEPLTRLYIDGKDVTEDLSRYIVAVTYRDSVEARSDTLTVVLTSEDDRFAGDWYPPKGSILEIHMGYTGRVVSTGRFVIDEVEYDGMPYRVVMRALAAVPTAGIRTPRTATYENVTLADIVIQIAGRHGLEAAGLVDTSLVLPRCIQNRETDVAFLARLAEDFGYYFSVRGRLLYFGDKYAIEAAEPITTILMGDVSRFSFRDGTMRVKRVSRVRYLDPDTGEIGEGLAERVKYKARSYRVNSAAAGQTSRYTVSETGEGAGQDQTTATTAAAVEFARREGFTTPFSGQTDSLSGRELPPSPAPPVPNDGFQVFEQAATRVPYAPGLTQFNYTEDLNYVVHLPHEVNGTDEDENVTFEGGRSADEAAARAAAANHASTTAQIIATLTLQGRPELLAGNSILLAGFGARWDGKYFITESTHDRDGGQYRTQVRAKKV